MPASFQPYVRGGPHQQNGMVDSDGCHPNSQRLPMSKFPTPTAINSYAYTPAALAVPPLDNTEYSVFSQIGSLPRDLYVNPLWTDVIPPNGLHGHPSLLQEGTAAARPRSKAIQIRRPNQSPPCVSHNSRSKLEQQTDNRHGQGFKCSLQPSGLSKFVSRGARSRLSGKRSLTPV